ncbi:MAG: hypothetical protein FJ279_16450, partial [Planctomycetes bacterium]|nr:hypothetical protein [Planctomycetota bacterium]
MSNFAHILRSGAAALMAVCVLLMAATGQAADGPRRTLVFCRGQMKYGLDENYLWRWVDRPLFQDSSLRGEAREFSTTYASYKRMVGIARTYLLDGFAFFPETTGRMGIYQFHDRARPEGFALLPEFIANQDMEPKRALLRAALACQTIAKLDGRIPITAYRTDSLPPETWAKILTAFRAEFGNAFIFLPDVRQPWGALMDKFHGQERIPQAEIEELKAYLRRYVAVFDGLYFAGAAGIKKDRRFDERFYRELLIPACRAVMAEPASRGKYFGLSACIGHENCTRLGYTLSHDGTKTLRRSLSAALDAKPDLIVI